MKIVDFNIEHIETATKIAKQNYEQERSFVPALPLVNTLPDLKPYAENGLGVAAYEGGTMIGFLCSVPAFKNAFNSTDAIGVFSPMGANGAAGATGAFGETGANGAIDKNRAKVYARMYQAAGEKWVRAGASSHAVCLYAHDTEVQEQFFHYGFGLRCVDAIRGMDEISVKPCEGYSFSELGPNEISEILPLENMLNESHLDSPFFMYRAKESEAEFLTTYDHLRSIYFIAKYEGQIVAFVRAELDGENFICSTPGYMHVKGAYCLPEHRGKGLNKQLLSMLIQKLKAKGYTRLGVDFESLNPTAYGFWPKYFDAYTHSVVRRIDEKIFENFQN
jgi:GNAT superfamily N-acetyltransferase